MTERKKLGLSKPLQAEPSHPADLNRKAPARGQAPRKRPSAAEAAQAREEAAARGARFQAEETQQRSPHQDRDPRDQRDPRARQARDPRPAYSQEQPYRARDDRAPYGTPNRDQAPPPEAARDQRGQRDRRPDLRQPRPGDAQWQPTPQAQPQADHDGRVRLSKLMSEKGLSSRREADEWIEQGWVRVDGEVVCELGSRVLPDQVITIDPMARTQQAQRVTILIHKPIGYVSGQAEDGYEPAVTLITPDKRWADDHQPLQLTRGHLRHLAPAGRLDIDSTGLLVLTQDGRIAKQLIGEDSGIEKEYLVRVASLEHPGAEDVSAVTDPEVLERLRFGLALDGRQLKPAQVSWQNEHQLRFVLREGRKRQIRRMCDMVGLKVVGLKRVRMGRITLGKLPVGEWRFLRPDERF